MRWLGLLILLMVPGAAVAEQGESAVAAGRAVLIQHECTRCHVIDDLPPATRPRDCVGCHQFIQGLAPHDERYKQIAARYGAAVIERYQKNISHLLVAPNLTRLAARVRPDWIADFLAAPYDVRPALSESMIRHRLSPDEQRTVVRYFAAIANIDEKSPSVPVPASDPTRVAAGEALFLERGCPACHSFGNRDTGVDAATLASAGAAAALAPNLRFVKTRTRPEILVDWLIDPARIAPHTLMPAMGLDRAQAELIRDFLFGADPQLHPAPVAVPQVLPPLLPRQVSYAEMKENVLGKVCVHCHMNAFEKDTGPGNLGGLGFAGVGLMMRTYETLLWGAVGADGKRHSVLQPRPGETIPPILQAMLRRREEERRDHVPSFADYPRPAYPSGPLGMPLGLPSMNDHEIALLATWIAQGCKGPATVSGHADVGDGYLVPDGPIAKNQGCELRAPSVLRPEWAFDREGRAGIDRDSPAR
ncbi:putative cytochrome oxidase (Cbb3-type) [Candidatus Terasakiella magnetica]|nr:putative cytochrome oxidase (Cbb3-type) [Candidatus Terasakiella magnetica]